MISVEEAINLIISNAPINKKTETLSCDKAIGRVLAEDITAPISLPPFNQSAMDGYGVRLSSGNSRLSWKLTDEIKAGDALNKEYSEDEAVRIFTGAKVPDSINCVIMQEVVKVSENMISVETADHLKHFSNIRPKGDQIKEESIAVKKGTLLAPSAIGFISSLGIQHIPVVAFPKVSIVVTGNELQMPGQPLGEAQIYESNAVMLKAVLQDTFGIDSIEIHRVKDNLEDTKGIIKKILNGSDLVLFSGGISVGKYDYVKQALEESGVKNIFYKVAQKPGKPLYFGTFGEKAIFGLPGNPAASLTCFYIYIYPWLRKYLNFNTYSLPEKTVSLKNSFSKKAGLSNFLKGNTNGNEAEILTGQESYILLSYTEANSLIYLPQDVVSVSQGDKVKAILLKDQ